MLKLETEADLQRLVDDKISESLTLDYKSSAALDRADGKKKELTKDVSALANSAGGQLIYGIIEKNQEPISLDSGSDRQIISPEWIEQILTTSISPRIVGLHIQMIPLAAGGDAYVITVPQATSRAPHQASDWRYYRRHNFMSVPMEDYEVRDALRRADSPEPFVRFKLDRNPIVLSYENSPAVEQSREVRLLGTISNRSNAPAEWVVIQVFLSRRLNIAQHNFDNFSGIAYIEAEELSHAQHKFGPPGHFPIFKETTFSLPSLSFAVPAVMRESEAEFTVGYHVATPGFSGGERTRLHLRNGELRMSDDWTTLTLEAT